MMKNKMTDSAESKQRSPVSGKKPNQLTDRSPERGALNRNGNNLLYKQRAPTMRDVGVDPTKLSGSKPPAAAHLKGKSINLGNSTS